MCAVGCDGVLVELNVELSTGSDHVVEMPLMDKTVALLTKTEEKCRRQRKQIVQRVRVQL